uniref:Uncharacterized protein n=1 Tax=Rhizophora mucronata TaxID=61149 RepID=A0A2P2N3A0_RHIMU
MEAGTWKFCFLLTINQRIGLVAVVLTVLRMLGFYCFFNP